MVHKIDITISIILPNTQKARRPEFADFQLDLGIHNFLKNHTDAKYT